MPKFDGSHCIAVATQVGEGTFNATLDGLTTSITAAQGLLLPREDIEVTFAREEEEPAAVAGSFTMPMGAFKRRIVESLKLVVDFCGNRASPGGAPADADFVPITGLDALMHGLGISGSAWGSGVGQLHVYASTNPVSVLLHYNGVRYELLDCRVSGEIEFTAGSPAKGSFEIAVGSIKDVTEAALPTTLTYGVQATVAPPIVEGVAHAWGATRGFETLTLGFEQEIEDVPDSNVATGFVKDKTSRVTKISIEGLYTDDSDEDFADTQAAVNSSGSLSQLSFQVGTNGVTGQPVKAVQIVVPQPVLVSVEKTKLGSKAAENVELEARHDTANAELQIIFR
jgi:hypothetical protein